VPIVLISLCLAVVDDNNLSVFSPLVFSVILVVHGLGDQYTESPPWTTSLETSLRTLQRNVTRQSAQRGGNRSGGDAESAAPTHAVPVASGSATNSLWSASSAGLTNLAPSRPPGAPSPADAASAATDAPAVLLVPLEYHAAAQAELSEALAPHLPAHAAAASAPVRSGIQETLGDVVIASSAAYRALVAVELRLQIGEQIAAVRRARPNFPSGKVSILAHSTGAVFALDLLQRGSLDDIHALDALILVGSPAAAFFALDSDFATAVRKAIQTRRESRSLRIFNVYHALDPVSYRLAPFLISGMTTPDISDVHDKIADQPTSVPPLVQVGQFDKQNLWEGATSFWDDAVHNVLSALFPGRKVNDVTNQSLRPDCMESAESKTPSPLKHGNTPLQRSSSSGMASTRANRIYMTRSENEAESDLILEASEVLQGHHVDFELQDSMGSPSIDVVSNWAAVQAHGFYWRSLEISRIIVDVAATSPGPALSSRNAHKLSRSEGVGLEI
jgi:hypothetical protein